MSDSKPEELEVQEPQKKEKKSLGVSLPLIIGAAVGILVIIVLGVVLGVVLSNKFMGGGHSESADGKGKGKTENVGNKSKNLEEEFAVEEGYLSKLEDIMIMETGRITTNPKGAASVFVVVNFGLEFKKMDPDSEELKTLAKEGAVNLEHPLMRKLGARMRGILNNMLASYTQQELLDKRQEMPELVKKELKPIFRDYELLLGNITIQEFIIQE